MNEWMDERTCEPPTKEHMELGMISDLNHVISITEGLIEGSYSGSFDFKLNA